MKLLSHKNMQGVTFIELIVVIGIFGIIAGIILFKYGDFTQNINLQNLTHTIALQVKKAQIAGSSGKFDQSFTGNPSISPSIYKPTYGIYFEQGTGSTPASFTYFVDKPGVGPTYLNDFYFDAGTEVLDTIAFQNGFTIAAICYNNPGGGISAPGCGYSSVALTFTRPDLSASFSIPGNSAYPTVAPSTIDDIEIFITGPGGLSPKKLIIYRSGAMTVQ